MRSHPVKENQIGTAVIENIRYKQTDRYTDTQKHIMLLYYYSIENQPSPYHLLSKPKTIITNKFLLIEVEWIFSFLFSYLILMVE